MYDRILSTRGLEEESTTVTKVNDTTREQLLTEAALNSFAIETCDADI